MKVRSRLPRRCAALATIFLTAGPALAQQEPRHADKIELFAKTMAIAKTVKEGCPRLSLDDGFLEAVRQRLHVEQADFPAFAPQARAAADVLARARDKARPGRLGATRSFGCMGLTES